MKVLLCLLAGMTFGITFDLVTMLFKKFLRKIKEL